MTTPNKLILAHLSYPPHLFPVSHNTVRPAQVYPKVIADNVLKGTIFNWVTALDDAAAISFSTTQIKSVKVNKLPHPFVAMIMDKASAEFALLLMQIIRAPVFLCVLPLITYLNLTQSIINASHAILTALYAKDLLIRNVLNANLNCTTTLQPRIVREAVKQATLWIKCFLKEYVSPVQITVNNV